MHEGVRTPTPPSERRAWLIALVLCLLGAGVLAAVLGGVLGSSGGGAGGVAADPPAVLVDAATPAAAGASEAALRAGRGTVAGPYAGNAGAGHGRGMGASGSGTARARGNARGRGGPGAPGGTGTAVPTAGTVVASAPGGASSSGAAPSGASGGDASSGAASSGEAGASAAAGTAGAPEAPISAAWESGFYPIYAEAQRVFGVNWLLLASIHMQETAFSTAPSTYHGLNFAHCCGGPMQFNVTNGGAGFLSTWDLVKGAYRFGVRPAAYDHHTANHPSIYDDYDAIMAAAWLLYSDSAGAALDDSAWWAAYDYYGHDSYGVQYADEVLARAIGWSQHGFCINCGVSTALERAVYEAYGAPVEATLEAEEATSRARAKRVRRGHRRRRPRRG